MYENNGYYQPESSPVPTPVMGSDPEVNSYVDAAFGKALASAIMCEFPIASIIAISFGSTALDLTEQAKRLAAERGVKPSGKNIAATVLGKIGKILGIIMTVFWGVYLLILLILMMSIV